MSILASIIQSRIRPYSTPTLVNPNAIYMSNGTTGPMGDDTTGDGTIENPYRSIAKISEVVQPGDTVYIRGGWYDEMGVDVYLTPVSGSGPEVVFSGANAGTETNPITIRSYPGEWAVFDGINHPGWPLTSAFGSAYEPSIWYVTSEWVNFEYLEFRNSVGRCVRSFTMNGKWRYCVFQNYQGHGLEWQGQNNEVAYNLAQDAWSVATDGNSGNGFIIQGNYPDADGWLFDRHGVTTSTNNHFHHNIMRNVSDDGIDSIWVGEDTGNVFEYNVSFEHGYGTAGNGLGYKMGLKDNYGNLVPSGDTWRYNVAWDCLDGFGVNGAIHTLIHNNTAYNHSGFGFGLWEGSAGSGDVEAYNNLSLTPNSYHRIRETGVTVHESNAGYTGRWDPGGGEGNFDTSDLDPKVLSLDWTDPDFLKLDPTSPYASAGQLVDTLGNPIPNVSATLGAIPDGEEFAGGWDWRALVNAYPSHGLKDRTPFEAIPQTSRTPYPTTGGGSPISFDIIGVGSSVDTYADYPETGPVTDGNWYVDPTAGTNGIGTEASPFNNLASAIAAYSADDVVLVKGGTLTPGSRFRISGPPINIYNYGIDRPIIDCSSLGTGSSARVFTLESDGHHIKGFEIKNSAEYPVLVTTANNKLEDLWVHDCAKTNIYLFGTGANNNLVQDVWSWRVQGAATAIYDDDNFASTANSGTTNSGNKFIRCVAANGPDDGFDLYRGTGVQIKSSVAIGAGYYSNGSNAGDGNGFKMGGQSGNNSVEGSIAVGVKVQGFDSNSESTITYFRNTAVDCGTRGFNVYSSPASQVKENISIGGGVDDRSGTLGTYNSWNSSSDAGGDTAFPLSLAEIDFADPANYDYSLDTASEAIGAGETGGNIGASPEALEILKRFMAEHGASVYHR